MKPMMMSAPSALKCDDRHRPIHDAGSLLDCPTCAEKRAVDLANWRPPRWQLITPLATYDYQSKPRNPFVRLAMFLRGYRWRVNPALLAGAQPRR